MSERSFVIDTLPLNSMSHESKHEEPAFTPWPSTFVERYRAAGYWTEDTLDKIVRDGAHAHADRIAVVCGARRLTYGQLDARVDQLASGFAALGIEAGDRVVLQLPNIAEYLVTVFALFRLGALPVFALPAHRRAELGYFLAHTQAKCYVIADTDGGFDYRQLARSLAADASSLQHVVVIGDAEEFVPFESLYRPARQLSPPSAADVAFLQLSGGSTGLPKLIPRTHRDYFYSVRASAQICQLNCETVYLCALPAAHNFPMSSPGTLGVLYAGGCVVMARRADPETAFALIAAERVTMTALVPPLAMVWMEAAANTHCDLSSLRLLQVGGARLSDEAAKRVQPTLGCALQQVFGMAEGLVNYTRLDDAPELVANTQGTPISPLDEVRVVDDDDIDVAVGEPGHLLTRGPYTIRGYYKADAHNARAFTADGFYRTGDIVRRLPSGHLIVEGRAKDQINRGGDKIAAEEVENHLLAHPAVLDAAVVAMPDAYLGERSCAFVIPRGVAPRAMEVAAFMRQSGLAQFKVPDRIEFIDQFPKTGVGKVDKRALRARIQHLLAPAAFAPVTERQSS